MTAQVSSRSKDLLAKLQTNLSRQATERIVEIQRQVADRNARDATEQASREKKWRREEERRKQGLAKRIPLAHQGLARILTVGTGEVVQKIIADLKRIDRHTGVLAFYAAQRLSGDAFALSDKEIDFEPGTRDVEVLLYDNFLRVFSGSFSSGSGITWKIYYNPRTQKEAILRSDPPDENYITLEDFLEEIGDPYPSNMSLAGYPRQRSVEWQPDDIVFQLLVSCARADRFNRYLSRLRPAIPI